MINQEKLLERYAGQSYFIRAHIKTRLSLCPFEPILPFIPSHGRLLDIGCGHGLFPHLVQMTYPKLEITGSDTSAEKIASAQKTVRPEWPITFITENPFKKGVSWSCITIVDVLYLLTDQEKRALLEAAFANLAPGGQLVIKEVDTAPWFKYAWTYFEEFLAVKLLHVTKGQDLHFQKVSDLEALLQKIGFKLETSRSLAEGYMYPHAVVAAKRP